MFECWNDSAYSLAAMVLAIVLACGFMWGFRRAQRKYEHWIRQMGEPKAAKPNVRRVKV